LPSQPSYRTPSPHERIPEYVLRDQDLAFQLPAFFRTLSGQKPLRNDLEKLLEFIIRAGHP
jgi:hypothetical protein